MKRDICRWDMGIVALLLGDILSSEADREAWLEMTAAMIILPMH
jgi:hypothetical protein